MREREEGGREGEGREGEGREAYLAILVLKSLIKILSDSELPPPKVLT